MHGRLASAVNFRDALQLNKGLVFRMIDGHHAHGQVGWMPRLPAGRQGRGGKPTL
jgi:hypothetical protein